MRCQPYNHPASRRGAAVVELAVILPVLVLLFVVAVDYARVFHYALTVANCARNGALYGRDTASAAESPFTSIKDAALADAASVQPTPTVSSTTGTDSAGQQYVEVTVTYDFRTITAYPLMPSSVTLSRTVRMHVAATLPQQN